MYVFFQIKCHSCSYHEDFLFVKYKNSHVCVSIYNLKEKNLNRNSDYDNLITKS